MLEQSPRLLFELMDVLAQLLGAMDVLPALVQAQLHGDGERKKVFAGALAGKDQIVQILHGDSPPRA